MNPHCISVDVRIYDSSGKTSLAEIVFTEGDIRAMAENRALAEFEAVTALASEIRIVMKL